MQAKGVLELALATAGVRLPVLETDEFIVDWERSGGDNREAGMLHSTWYPQGCHSKHGAPLTGSDSANHNRRQFGAIDITSVELLGLESTGAPVEPDCQGNSDESPVVALRRTTACPSLSFAPLDSLDNSGDSRAVVSRSTETSPCTVLQSIDSGHVGVQSCCRIAAD